MPRKARADYNVPRTAEEGSEDEKPKTKIVRIMGKNYEVPLDYVFDPNRRNLPSTAPSSMGDQLNKQGREMGSSTADKGEGQQFSESDGDRASQDVKNAEAAARDTRGSTEEQSGVAGQSEDAQTAGASGSLIALDADQDKTEAGDEEPPKPASADYNVPHRN